MRCYIIVMRHKLHEIKFKGGELEIDLAIDLAKERGKERICSVKMYSRNRGSMS